jgi:hypothetical protein
MKRLENGKKLEDCVGLENGRKLENDEGLKEGETPEQIEKAELLEELDYSKFFGHYSKSRRPDDRGVFSVKMRGLGGQAIYREKQDYIIFLKILNKLLHRYNAVLYGFALMTNHAHFLVRCSNGVCFAAARGVGDDEANEVDAAAREVDADAARGVGDDEARNVGVDVINASGADMNSAEKIKKLFSYLIAGYTGYYSKKHKTKGRLIAYPPEFSEKVRLNWQLNEIIYMVNNPVVARMTENSAEYQWDSYLFYTKKGSPLAQYIDVDASLVWDNFDDMDVFFRIVRSKAWIEKRMSKFK